MTPNLTTHVITAGVSYTSHPDHRNRSLLKSQWTITEHDEVGSFRVAHQNGWIDTDCGWGLHRPNGSAEQLGVAIDGTTRLYLAKFVSKHTAPWHGYPADHQRRLDDVPTERHLNEWLQQGIMSSATVRKLVRQQPCNL